jgi:hypothetical protein
MGVWTGLSWLRIETGGAGTFECGKEPLGFTKYGELLD